MRNSSSHPFAVTCGILSFALAISAIESPGPLRAQGQLKRQPLPDSIQTATDADRYLATLDVDELLGFERVEPVCIHFLKRSGVPEFARLEAIKRLAEMRQTDPVTELLPWIERLDASDGISEPDLSTLSDLAALLPQQPTNALKKLRDRVRTLALRGKHAATRRSAMAALAAADRSYDEVWSLAGESSQSLLDVLRSVPQLPSDLPRAALFKNVQPLLRDQANPEIQSAAIEAAALLGANGRETFDTLSDFVLQGVHPEACVRAICNIPSDRWTDSRRKPLANSLISRLAETPIQQRASRDARSSIKLIKTLASLMPSQDEAEIRSRLDKYVVTVFRVAAVEGAARYDQDVLVARKGKPVQISFRNDDVKPHNLVVVNSIEVREAIGRKQDDDAGDHELPPSEHIVAATEVVRPGETDSITFVTPDKAGIYLYLCTLPGHSAKRYGAIVIVNDVQKYRAEHQPLPTADELLGVIEK